jgi:hypothetical protein
MAQSRHAQCADECPLLGASRTLTNRVHDDPSGEPALSQGLPSEAEPRRENLWSRRGDKFLRGLQPQADAGGSCIFPHNSDRGSSVRQCRDLDDRPSSKSE